MQWILSTADHEAASELRREVREHLARHARNGSDLDVAEIAFSELLTNAVEHAGTRVWVELDWSQSRPVVTIHDLGDADLDVNRIDATTVDPDQPDGRGLLIARAFAREVTMREKADSGIAVSAVLDVERARTASHDPTPRHSEVALPRPAEADEQGFFGATSFLRSLVVEMATAIEAGVGPALTERTVATVGSTVGQQMEAAFRAARELIEPLDVEQLGEIYVGLKAAIGGDFEVVEMHPDRIVLENGHCPFGDVVRDAPSLCRMTSSVFGGIAARNTGDDVAIHLEERIAVGDAHCRVIVWLSTPPEEIAPYVHTYRPPSAEHAAAVVPPSAIAESTPVEIRHAASASAT